MNLKLNNKSRKNWRKVAKKYQIFGTSLNVQGREFFEKSTLHGVRYIAEKGRPFVEKFLWFACVAIGAVATMIIIVSLWDKFQTNPTITGLDTDFHNWEVPFPAITVCQEAPFNLTLIDDYLNGTLSDEKNVEATRTLLKKMTELSYETMKEFVRYANKSTSLAKDIDIKETAFQLMNSCEDVFDTCTWKNADYDCCQGFFPVFTERGFCYAFNSRHYETYSPWNEKELPQFNMQYIKETDIKWSLKFKVRSDQIRIPIYILNSDEIAGIDVQPQHIWDFNVSKISFSVKQTYTTEDTKQLSIKQRHCAFADEKKLKTERIYTYTACTRQCRMDIAMKKCKCVPHFYPAKGEFRHCRIDELSCIAANLESIKSVDHCSCQLGCSNTVYEVEKLNENSAFTEGEKTEMETEFVSWPMVRYKREVLFGWVDLLVSFGGIAGLFLGFSLLSGVEAVYYFTVRACCMAHREQDVLERERRERESRPPPEYDLSLVPYFISKPLPGHGVDQVAGFYGENIARQGNNKIAPAYGPGVWKPKDRYFPPFGIEFTH